VAGEREDVRSYSPDQPRDEQGRFGEGGGAGAAAEPEAPAWVPPTFEVSSSPSARPEVVADVHKALSDYLPTGGQRVLKEMGVEIKVVAEADGGTVASTRDGVTYRERGRARFDDRTLTIDDHELVYAGPGGTVRGTALHEAGHFSLAALAQASSAGDEEAFRLLREFRLSADEESPVSEYAQSYKGLGRALMHQTAEGRGILVSAFHHETFAEMTRRWSIEARAARADNPKTFAATRAIMTYLETAKLPERSAVLSGAAKILEVPCGDRLAVLELDAGGRIVAESLRWSDASVEKSAELISTARRAADDVLKRFGRVGIVKALDPLDRRDFLVIIRKVSRALEGAAGDAERTALRSVIGRLDVDWTRLSPEATDQAFAAIRQATRGVGARVMPAVDVTLAGESEDLIRATKNSTIERYRLRIGADLSLADERIARHVVESQANFVRDNYGRRSEAFGPRARGIVARGLEEGLGRDDIAGDLEAALGETMGRPPSYWQVVAGAFANEARTWTGVASMDEAGLRRYRIEAVMDEATSEICRLLHGRVFEVRQAMKTFDRVSKMTDPEQIKEVRPWVTRGVDDERGDVLYFNQDGGRQIVASVDRPGEGELDQSGEYSGVMDEADLADAGVLVPPFHGCCRTTIVAEF
jgi:hypothetical protein